MEGIHGVDVSWLHHSPKDHGRKATQVLPERKEPQASETTAAQNISAPARSDGSVKPFTQHDSPHRSPLNRSASAKAESTATSPAPSPAPAPVPAPLKGSKESKLGPMGRRNSWMSSISSKFSSNTATGSSNTVSEATTNGAASPKSPKPEQSNPLVPTPSGAKEIKKAEAPASSPPASPKTHTFLQSALRRLSSSGNTTLGKAAGSGGVCARKTMNIDPYRERCAVPELDRNKLRRVAFCVDVEIAGSAQYTDDIEQPPARPLDDEPSLTKLEKEIAAKKQKSKDQKLQRSEGEALKRSNAIAEEKEIDGIIKATGENVDDHKAADLKVLATTNGDSSTSAAKEPSKKKEKKKRSEGERKERKERKQQEALANGTIPAEIKNDGSEDSSNGTTSPPKGQDRPTTDPLRIYRRCCQLRETPVLKRISEQISSPSACQVATPGVLSLLDLSGYWMQLPDVITLGDYLAVVPVRKLILENCGLGDEAVRVLFAGLLAAKTPEQAKYNRKLAKKSKAPNKEAMERMGVIEKVSLKNNPKIGKEGWRHIACFINMSRSLKGIDISMIPFPEDSTQVSSVKPQHHNPLHHSHAHDAPSAAPPMVDLPTIIQESLAGRLAGNHLEELVMAECGLSTNGISKIVDGVTRCGVTRLGLASNNMTKEGLEHVLQFLRSGICEGLDIGGNDIHEHMAMLSDSLDPSNMLWALSLADCQLSPSSLEQLLPALSRLPNVRFIDLSHNRGLFSTKPSALRIIRKYLPLFPMLKRIHLMDVAMTPEHVIALAETLPECRALAHLNVLDNHLLAPLASAKTEAAQEEACAMYASLMAAVRVSETIICIDIDVPSEDSGEIVKALAKQVVAYSLHNLERLPLESVLQDSAIANMTEPHGGQKELTVPDVLIGLVGHIDGIPENHDHDPPAPDDDYIVGGTGVVKALDICLNRAERSRKGSPDPFASQSGTGTPSMVLQDGELTKGKAKDMSKNLLDSARKIRARLQPALIKEAKAGNYMSHRRLQFLDSTLQRMIQRFEDEYPETRIGPPAPTAGSSPGPDNILSDSHSINNGSNVIDTNSAVLASSPPEEDASSPLIRPASISCRTSSPNLASRQAQEEGRMHRFGQRIKRDILRPQTEDYAHGTTGAEEEPEHLRELRLRLEDLGGEEIKAKVERLGPEAALATIETEGLKKEMGEWNPGKAEDSIEKEAEEESLEEWRGRVMAASKV